MGNAGAANVDVVVVGKGQDAEIEQTVLGAKKARTTRELCDAASALGSGDQAGARGDQVGSARELGDWAAGMGQPVLGTETGRAVGARGSAKEGRGGPFKKPRPGRADRGARTGRAAGKEAQPSSARRRSTPPSPRPGPEPPLPPPPRAPRAPMPPSPAEPRRGTQVGALGEPSPAASRRRTLWPGFGGLCRGS